MGRRTLLAIARSDGRFDCRYAHWGASMAPVAQSRPVGVGWTAADVVDAIDAGFDQLLVRAGTTRRYCVCWLDPTVRDPEDIALARTDDPHALRAWWTARKDEAVGAVADGDAPRRVRASLLAALRARVPAVHLPDDASFLPGDR